MADWLCVNRRQSPAVGVIDARAVLGNYCDKRGRSEASGLAPRTEHVWERSHAVIADAAPVPQADNLIGSFHAVFPPSAGEECGQNSSIQNSD